MRRTKPNSMDSPKVLILCQDARSCYQLKQFLTQSGERYLLFAAMKNNIPIGKLGKSYEKIKNAKELDMIANQSNTTMKTTQNKSLPQTQKKTEDDDTNLEATTTPVDELTQLLLQGDEDTNLDANYFQESYMLTMTQAQFNDDSDLILNDSGNGDASLSSVDNSIFEPFPEVGGTFKFFVFFLISATFTFSFISWKILISLPL